MRLVRPEVVFVGALALVAGCAQDGKPSAVPSGIENTGSAGITGGAARRAEGSGQVSAAGQDQSLGSIIGSNPDFSTWYSMSVQGNYFQELSGSGKYTVFVPVNSAFEKVPANLVLQDLKGQGSMQMPNITRLQSVVRNQVVRGSVAPDQLRRGKTFTALSGYRIVVGGSEASPTVTMRTPRVGGGPNIGGTSVAQIVGEPTYATNGVIYPVDTLFAR